MTTQACVHHYILEPYSKRRDLGRCKRCGETRLFDNSQSAGYLHIPRPSSPDSSATGVPKPLRPTPLGHLSKYRGYPGVRLGGG